MFINRLSASAVKTYKWCPWQYWLSYVLELENQTGKAACQGNIVHLALEWIAKLHQKGKEIDAEWLLSRAWDEELSRNPHLAMRRTTQRGESADYRKCREGLETVLNDQDYDPRRSKVLGVEHRFDISFPGPQWALKDRDGKQKQFRITGYMDLVRELNPNTLEVVDWKTGAKKDLATQLELDFYALMREVQPRLYHFAASQLYPEYENVVVTFYYTSDDGPEVLPFTFEDIVPTVAAIYRFFTTVRGDQLFRRCRSWKCKNFCAYGRTGVCDAAWAELHASGEAFTSQKYAKMGVEQQRILGGKSDT